jgi:NAD-dependent dihydropyrimidine dehydrogenase PreA subunit
MIISQNKILIAKNEWQCSNDVSNSVIEEINQYILEVFNTTHSPTRAQEKIYTYLENNCHEYGFCNIKCYGIVTNIINKYYNSKIETIL